MKGSGALKVYVSPVSELVPPTIMFPAVSLSMAKNCVPAKVPPRTRGNLVEKQDCAEICTLKKLQK